MTKRFIFKKLILWVCFIIIFATGCGRNQPEANYPAPTGIWSTAWDGFEVKNSPNQFYYYCDTSKSIAMAGNILETVQNGD